MKIRSTYILLLFGCCIAGNVFGQRYKSDSSYVHFYSDAPVEDIEAYNLDSQSAIDVATGDIVFSIPITSFQFDKSLMQEHFNENYLESEQYPTATFIGKLSQYDASINTVQKAVAKGTMKIHGVEKEMTVEGDVEFREDAVRVKAKFPITLEDHKIKIPKVVFYNIAEVVDVTVNFRYEKLE